MMSKRIHLTIGINDNYASFALVMFETILAFLAPLLPVGFRRNEMPVTTSGTIQGVRLSWKTKEI